MTSSYGQMGNKDEGFCGVYTLLAAGVLLKPVIFL